MKIPAAPLAGFPFHSDKLQGIQTKANKQQHTMKRTLGTSLSWPLSICLFRHPTDLNTPPRDNCL